MEGEVHIIGGNDLIEAYAWCKTSCANVRTACCAQPNVIDRDEDREWLDDGIGMSM